MSHTAGLIPVQDEDLVEFRLLYQGHLPAAANGDSKRREKHEIRRILHPQLRRLWNVEPNLRSLAINEGNRLQAIYPPIRPLHEMTNEERVQHGLQAIGKQWARVGFEWVPLVTRDHALRCSLNILLLRPEEDKYLFTRGDIDGQLKTLFDALRMPENTSEIRNEQALEDETPFFCLLHDDRLISDVHVDSSQLLLLPGERQVKATDAFVVIHVKLNHRSARTFDNIFG